MVNVSLIEAILHEQDNPGLSTTRKIRDIYNNRSGENPIIQHSDEDQQFQKILFKTLETLPIDNNNDDGDDDDDQPISYTVKLKDSDDSSTPTMKRRSIIKLPKETKEQSESDNNDDDDNDDNRLSDTEKFSTASSITITKPFSPLFLNNMKKFGVSTDWLAKRSNSLRQSSYSRSSVKSNASKLDAMIKSASTKPIRSNRKLSFIESPTSTRIQIDNKENSDPSIEKDEEEVAVVVEEEEIITTKTSSEPTPYDLSSEIDEDKDEDSSSSKEFSLRIPRVNLPEEENKKLNSSSSSSSSNEKESKQEKIKIKKKRKSKKSIDKKDQNEQISIDDNTKKSSPKKEKNNQAQSRIEHLKKLLRISGIRPVMKKTELEQFSSNKAKINYLKSLFDTAGYIGSLSIKECGKFRQKRDTEKELLEIQANVVDIKGHVKGGRTLRGQARTTDEFDLNIKRKRTASSEIEENDNSSDDDEKPIIKKRRILQMEASPEVSDNE